MGKALFGLFLLANTVWAQNIDIRFTNPKCGRHADKPQNAFCTRVDLQSAQSNPEGPYQKIIELIRQTDNRKMTLGTMSFSNKSIAKELCAAIKRGVTVEVLIDSGVPFETATEVSNCGAQIHKIGSIEEEGVRGDLHHNKFLLVEKNNEKVLVVSTGNFSNPALSINHETWSFIKPGLNSKIIEEHQCLIESLKKYQKDLSQFNRDLNRCRKGLVNHAEKIESLFVPTDSKKLLTIITQQMKNSKQILMTSNRYSYDVITSAFQLNTESDRRAIFDDDLYWGGLQPTEDYVNEALDAKKIAKLEKTTSVRYMQTSFGAAQKMHNKFIVFDSMVIVGAGNYTFAGLTSNFENFYLIKDQKIVEKFKKQFEYLWSLSTPRQNMPQVYSDPGKTP